MQPERVSPEEQQLIEKLQWEIGSCTLKSTSLQSERKTTKAMVERKKNKLEELRSTQEGCLAKVVNMPLIAPYDTMA
jgi:hypothetical protein